MKGWIIYRDEENQLRPEAHEIHRLIEEAKKDNIDLEVFRPEQFDLIVTREDEKSILVDSEKKSLPDFVIPRMGAGPHISLWPCYAPWKDWASISLTTPIALRL
ncbi:MAG: hypothetical protein ACKVH8_04875 [Pirellulales bacterium]